MYTGKLSLVDLAGSERASETNNIGRQLKDGANINRYADLANLPAAMSTAFTFATWQKSLL